MPTYEYRCEKCGRFEHFQRISEQPLQKCPHCGGKVKRLISQNNNVIFKGSGFYTTDYRSQDSTKESGGDKDKAASA
ncbi:MAG: zinc ribbon domain-containing protein [Firmicutes bacterium]|nr:zinc ribbon domain-containing protein [Bacillota bacterium]